MRASHGNFAAKVDSVKDGGSQVTVAASDTALVANNPNRVELTICNDHATNIVYLKLGGAAAEVNKGIRLNAAGGSWTTQAFTGVVRAIATGASTVVTISEI